MSQRDESESDDPMAKQYRLEDCVFEFEDGTQCYALFGRYHHGLNIRIDLIDMKDQVVYCVATTNSDLIKVTDDQVMIKDWTENKGIVPILQKAGLIGDLISDNLYPVYTLLKKPKDFPLKKVS
jgi:hypothetical protein